MIITPLISLMLDQKETFVQKDLKVDFVGKAQHNEQALEAVINGQIQLVYVSPESLLENKCSEICCPPKFIKRRQLH